MKKRSPTVLAGSLLLTLALAACGGNDAENDLNPQSLTPRTGGLTLATAVSPAQPTAAAATATPAAPNQPAVAPRLDVGQNVVVETTLRLYATATTASPVLEEYPAGVAFTVIEPSGTYTSYPITVADRTWYRLQAEDGLVGWAIIDGVTARAD
jgi:cytoskeletal protein RodZ